MAPLPIVAPPATDAPPPAVNAPPPALVLNTPLPAHSGAAKHGVTAVLLAVVAAVATLAI